MIQKKMYLTPFRLSALVPCFWGRHTGSFTRQWRRHRLQLSPQIFCRRQAMSEHLLLWSILRMRNMIQTDACPMKKFPPICLAQTILNFIPVRAWLVILTVLHTDHCIWPEMYFITQRKVRSHPTKKRQMDLKDWSITEMAFTGTVTWSEALPQALAGMTTTDSWPLIPGIRSRSTPYLRIRKTVP